jgi:hypothetical protein
LSFASHPLCLSFLRSSSPATVSFSACTPPSLAMVRHPSLLVPSTQAECHAIVSKLCALVAASKLSPSSNNQPCSLLQSHFQDGSAGCTFRSMTCFRSKDSPATFNDFDKHVIGPSTHCCFLARPDQGRLAKIPFCSSTQGKVKS